MPFRPGVDLSEPPTGAPDLHPVSLPPAIGTNVGMRVDVTSRATMAAMLVGFLQSGVDLTVLGMPGCMQLNTGDVTFSMMMGAQSADINFGLPDNPHLIGREIHAQAVIFEPRANAFGLLTSNGLTLRFGACR